MVEETSSGPGSAATLARNTERLGLGLAALGRPAYMTLNHASDLGGCYDSEVMQARTHRVLDAAYEAGMRYIDTARSYGRAEEFVASWLSTRGLQPDEISVASKWGYMYVGRWLANSKVHEVKDHSIITFQRQLTETLQRLGSHVTVYQIHSVTAGSDVLRDAKVIDACARLRELGITPGLSVSGPEQASVIRRAMEVQREGRRVFDVVQATWNLYERSAEHALVEAFASGMKVVVKEALANGRLTDTNVEPDLARRLDHVRTLAADLNTTVDVVALASALALPWAGIVLTGAATPRQLRSNLGALTLESGGDLGEELRSVVMEPEDYWRVRSGFAWN